MTYPILTLRPGKERSIERGHLWVFSGALAPDNPTPHNGEVVEVRSANNRFLARGHYQKSGAISVRILTRRQEAIDSSFWLDRLRQAVDIRRRLGLLDGEKTDASRLVFGEGDFLPGLVIDFFAGNVVMQTHSEGMYQVRQEIADALTGVLGPLVRFICHKPLSPSGKAGENQVATLFGAPGNPWFQENGHTFRLNWEEGQKTGFYLDQRDNRMLVRQYAKGRKILNAFSYTGAFSVYAAGAGAESVLSLDSSDKAILQAKEHLEANGFSGPAFREVTSDTLRFLKETDEDFDLVILDPPAFAKRLSARHNAVQGYKRLNLAALQKIRKGGVLFTFSCSQAVDPALFTSTITAAVIESGRNARILHRLAQPPDHPVNPCHPESEYLKGLVLRVE